MTPIVFAVYVTGAFGLGALCGAGLTIRIANKALADQADNFRRELRLLREALAGQKEVRR